MESESAIKRTGQKFRVRHNAIILFLYTKTWAIPCQTKLIPLLRGGMIVQHTPDATAAAVLLELARYSAHRNLSAVSHVQAGGVHGESVIQIGSSTANTALRSLQRCAVLHMEQRVSRVSRRCLLQARCPHTRPLLKKACWKKLKRT